MFFIFCFFCFFFFFFFRLKSSISITETPTSMKICMCTYFLPGVCTVSGYIFVNPFTSCVIDRYQYKQCIMMETETETNMKICMYVLRFYWLCVQLVAIFLLTLLLVLLIVICPSNTLLCRPLSALPIKRPW